ncbi:hypothetical protein ABZ820_17430 [Streptomyces diacarni]|uniref:hypothetical protein n=1 Tax=Streptomyces diacarni TaxID=2800381 RepID=UPI0033F4B41A
MGFDYVACTATRHGQVYFDMKKARADGTDSHALEMGKLLNQFSSAQAKTPCAKPATSALGLQIVKEAAVIPWAVGGPVQ